MVQRLLKEQEFILWCQLIMFQWLIHVPRWDHLSRGWLFRQIQVAGLGFETDMGGRKGGRWLSSEHMPESFLKQCLSLCPFSSCTMAWQPAGQQQSRSSGPPVPLAIQWATCGAIHTLSPWEQGIPAYREGLCWTLTITGTWWYQYKITEDKEKTLKRNTPALTHRRKSCRKCWDLCFCSASEWDKLLLFPVGISMAMK